MTVRAAEPQAITLLRDIIEGDDAAMSRALEEGKKLLQMLKISGVRLGDADDLDKIMVLVATEYGLTVPGMLKKKRSARLVEARQLAMWLCRTITAAPFEEIGQKFGGRNHGTVMHAMDSVNGYVATSARFKAKLERLHVAARTMLGRTAE